MKFVQAIPAKAAALTVLVLLAGVVMFHVLVLAGVVPQNMVWGGRVSNLMQMQVLEAVSMFVVLLSMAIIASKAGYIKPLMPTKSINMALWMLVVFFSLNTVGNLFSATSVEMILFTPVTFISALLCYRLVITK